MTCPKARAIADREAGELTANDAADLARHLETCRACARSRAALQEAIADLREPTRDSLSSQAFVDRVTAALPGAELSRAPERRRPYRGPLAVGFLAIAAAVVLAIRLPGRPSSGSRDSMAGFQPRGGAPKTPLLEASIRLLRDGRFRPPEPVLSPADAFGVVVTNQTDAPVYLLAFAVDAAGDVHWFYPDYRAGGAPPRSVPIPPNTRGRTLEEVVQPEGVPSGPFRLVTVLQSEPVGVDEVERRLRGRDAQTSVAALFRNATVRESTATWKGQP
jgi:hypothetical protein